MRLISQLRFSLIETNAPIHGNRPWKHFPLSLVMRTTKDGISKFDGKVSYTGRDEKSVVMNINFTTTQDQTIIGTLDNGKTIELPIMALDRLGDGYYKAVWLNVMIPGVGQCKAELVGHAEDK